jgi:hypothetical protein
MSLLKEFFGHPLKHQATRRVGKPEGVQVLSYRPGRSAKLALPSGEHLVISIGSATAKVFAKRGVAGWLIPRVIASERLWVWQSDYRSFNSFHRQLSRAMILDGLVDLLSAYRSTDDVRKAWPSLQNPVVVAGREILGLPRGSGKQITETVREGYPEDIRESGRRHRASEVPKGWLKKRITVAEAEAKNMADLGLNRGANEETRRARLEFARSRGAPLTGGPVPFGFMNREWRELVASMLDGDELWEYRSSDESWNHLAGRAGIALVRKGEIVDAITTALN